MRNRMTRRVKDAFDEDEEPNQLIDVEVTFCWDDYLFQENYEEDREEYGLPEEIDSELVTEIAMDIDRELCRVISDYFGKHYCSYHSGSNGYGGDLTCFDTSVEESVLFDKLSSYDIPFSDAEIRNDDIYLHLDNSNSGVYGMFGSAIDDFIDRKYTDDVSRRIAIDIMEINEMGADLYITNPSERIIQLVQENI
jgi:hypothetical protein